MARYLSQGIVVMVDDAPASRVLPEVAVEAWENVHVLVAEGTDGLPANITMVHPAKGQVTLDRAFKLAQRETVPWVGIRRDLAPPQELLVQLLECTGRYATKDLPGFAALMMGSEVSAVERILCVVNLEDGKPSGLMTLIAVVSATSTGAELDVLVMGVPDRPLPSKVETVRDLFAGSRDRDLYEQALRRIEESGHQANWILVNDVTDPVSVVLDQLKAEHYQLVLDHLGDLKLGGRMGRGKRLRAAAGPNGPGAIPNAVLTQTDVPLLLVLDAVRLGIVSPTVVKASAAGLLALGAIGAAAPAGAATSRDRADASISQTVTDYEVALDQAAQGASPAAVEEAHDQAQESAKVASATIRGEEVPAEEAAPATDAEGGGTTEAAAPAADEEGTASEQAADEGAEGEDATAQDATGEEAPVEESADPVETLAPGSLDPKEVAPEEAENVKADDVDVDADEVSVQDAQKSQDEAAESKQDLTKAEEKFEEAQDESVDAKKDADQAAEQAAEASADLQAAQADYDETIAATQDTIDQGAGLSGVIPGTATDEEVAAAEAARQAAADELAAATQAADEALVEYEEAAIEANEAYLAMEEEATDLTQADAEHQEASAVAEAEQEAVASQRQAPVEGVDVGTHYGAHGSMWSTGTHTGIDYPAPTGTEVTAAASGTVVEVSSGGAYGNRVVIEHDDGYYTTYNHLSSISVSVGEEVTVGDKVGEVGSTGNSSGPHLHFEVSTGGIGFEGGTFIDPSAWLAGEA